MPCVHYPSDNPADLLDNALDVLRFVREATVATGVAGNLPLSPNALQGLDLVLAAVEETITTAIRQSATTGALNRAA